MKNPKLAFFVSLDGASAKAITHGSANHLSSSVIYSCCPPWVLLELLIPLIWKTFLHTQCVLKYYCNKRSGYFKYLSLPALPKYGHKRSFADIFLEEGAEKRGVIDAQPNQKTNRKTDQKNLRKDQSSAVFGHQSRVALRCFVLHYWKRSLSKRNYEMFQLLRAKVTRYISNAERP